MSGNKNRKANGDDEHCIATEKCSFGICLHADCHRNFKSEIVPLLNFSEQDQIIFQWRSGFNQRDPAASTLCTNISLKVDLKYISQNVVSFMKNM